MNIPDKYKQAEEDDDVSADDDTVDDDADDVTASTFSITFVTHSWQQFRKWHVDMYRVWLEEHFSKKSNSLQVSTVRYSLLVKPSHTVPHC